MVRLERFGGCEPLNTIITMFSGGTAREHLTTQPISCCLGYTRPVHSSKPRFTPL